MYKPRRTLRPLRKALLAAFLAVATAAAPARAASPCALAPPLAASRDDDYSVKRFISGLNRRDRVVQFSAAVMCLALFILCKKFGETDR